VFWIRPGLFGGDIQKGTHTTFLLDLQLTFSDYYQVGNGVFYEPSTSSHDAYFYLGIIGIRDAWFYFH
jgi:hypothetical protein